MAQNFLSDIQLGDNTYIRLGSATDGTFQMYHDGGHTQIALDGYASLKFKFDRTETDPDIVFDASQSGLRLNDGIPLILGTGSDGTIKSVSDDLIIENTTNDKDIILKTDNGSGGTAEYITLDGSATAITMHKDTTFSSALNFQKTGFTTITGSSNTFTINFATATNNYQFTLDNAACTIAFSNLSANVVGKSGNIIITNPSSVGSLSVGNLPSEAYSPGGATVSWDTNASSVSILSYFILASDKVLINYVGNFKSYGT